MSACIVGWSHTPFGRLETPDTRGLMEQVITPALDHAGIAARELDAAFVGVFNGGFSRQEFQAALAGVAGDDMGMVPAVRVENACATGSAAIHAAIDFIEAGRGRLALVVGAEKMTGVTTARASEILAGGSYLADEEARAETGFAGTFARITATYFQRYGDRSAALATIAAKNHANGVANPFAQLRRDLGFDFCNTVSDRNPLVAPPLRRTDCSPISDGAAALVLADARTAAALPRAIRFRGRAHSNDIFPLARRDETAFDGVRRAWGKALEDAGMALGDLSLVETHDCFTIAELIQYEAMGLAAPGEGYRVLREGTTFRDGALPVNLSGGLKSKGHPLGATGVSMHVLSAMQLCGEAGDMQKPGATTAGIMNMGGAAVANYVSILERMR